MALFSGGLLLLFIISRADDVLTARPSACGSSQAPLPIDGDGLHASLLRRYSAPPGCDSDLVRSNRITSPRFVNHGRRDREREILW